MNRDDDKELWDLLGEHRPQTLSPFFARNVVRQVRVAENDGPKFWHWFSGRRVIPAVAVALVVSGAAMFTWSHRQAPDSGVAFADEIPDVVAQLDAADYEVVADLDDLIASQEDDSWDDTLTL